MSMWQFYVVCLLIVSAPHIKRPFAIWMSIIWGLVALVLAWRVS